jgi:cell pole-organizing protein PopZ
MGDIQQDPSMEEILASIKRVIAADSSGPGSVARARRGVPAESPPPSEEDVLELDDPVTENAGLLSSDAAAASRERLAALSALSQREMPADTGPLEALVREMLKPILKEWLDEHLPAIVEQLVTREIARITGRSL